MFYRLKLSLVAKTSIVLQILSIQKVNATLLKNIYSSAYLNDVVYCDRIKQT